MGKPKARDVPNIWFHASEVIAAWEDSGAVLSDSWHTHYDQIRMRCVPLEVGEWLSSRARANTKGPDIICDKYAKACDCKIFDWYNQKELGRPAAGKLVWHDWDGPDEGDRHTWDNPVRHSMAWAMSDGGHIYILDTSFNTVYPPASMGGVYEYSWA